MSQILRGVEEVHLAQRIFNSERLEHRDHRGDADTGGDENERVFRLGVFKRKTAGRSREFDYIAHLHAVVKDGGDETVRRTLRAEDKLHGDAQHAAAGS